jgi:hypothetical protein
VRGTFEVTETDANLAAVEEAFPHEHAAAGAV